jgi:hypothetical protein
MRFQGLVRLSGFVVMAAVSSSARGQVGAAVSNWAVPANVSSTTPSGRMRTMGDVTEALPFVGVSPCRVVDTRGPAGAYGSPSLAAGVPRDFNLQAGPCTGLPASINAYSLNITVTNTQGPGFILIYPQGGTQPLVSTLNYNAGQTVANAAIVPAGNSNGITVVAGVSGTDLIIDINGYFTSSLTNPAQSLSLVGTASSGVLSVANTNSPFGLAIFAQSAGPANFDSAIEAQANTATGRTYGVKGFTNSTTAGAGGIYGSDVNFDIGLGGSTLTAGVLGASGPGYGVLGISRVDGVKGIFVDSGGTALTAGHLGHDGTNGVFASGNLAATGAKTFVEPHPLAAGKAIVYVALEGPEAGTYFRGRGTLHGGIGMIPVPESFRLVSDENGLTVQITPIGEAASVAVVSADLTSIVVRSPVRDLEFYYVVNGVRKAFKNWDPMGQPDYFVPEGPDARIPAGLAEEQRRRLIANGTYNADGTVNMSTAERAGWTRMWAEAAARTAAADSSHSRTATISR